jgi:hypothetical protein
LLLLGVLQLGVLVVLVVLVLVLSVVLWLVLVLCVVRVHSWVQLVRRRRWQYGGLEKAIRGCCPHRRGKHTACCRVGPDVVRGLVGRGRL